VEREIAPRLEPDLRADVLQDARFEARLDQHVMDELGALGHLAVELADREAVALDMVDDARRGHRRGGIDDAADETGGIDLAAEHARGIEALELAIVVLAAELLEVPPGQAVLHG